MSTTSNGIDPVTAQRFVGEIERKIDEKLDAHMSYMTICKRIGEAINDLKEAASNAGIPKKALNKILKERGLLRKLEELRESAEEDVRDLVDQIREALGDDFSGFGLGAAAVSKADGKPVGPEAPETPEAAKGKGRKKATASATAPAGGDPLGSLINDDIPAPANDQADLRPRHVQKAEEDRAALNAEALKRGIKELN